MICFDPKHQEAEKPPPPVAACWCYRHVGLGPGLTPTLCSHSNLGGQGVWFLGLCLQKPSPGVGWGLVMGPQAGLWEPG